MRVAYTRSTNYVHRRRVRKGIKGTEGVRTEYAKCREREIVTVEKGEGNRLFARRTRSTSCAGCALRKSSL